VRKMCMGPVPYSGALLDQRTLVRATGRRAGVTEAMRVWRDPGQHFANTGAEEEAPADGAVVDTRAVMVFVPPVRTCEVRGAVRPGPMPRQVRGDRLRRIENDRDALRQERDGLRVKVEDLVAETNRLKSVPRSKTQEVDDLRAELARLRGELRPRNRERSV
jgi:hypothetical protein